MRRRTFIAAFGPLLGSGLAGCLADESPGDDDAPGSQASSATAGPDGSLDGPATVTGLDTPTAPLVHWTFEFDRPAKTMTVVHDRGEVIRTETTDRLELVHRTGPDHPVPTDATLTPTRTPVVTRWSWQEAGGGPFPVRPGDAATIDGVTPGDTVAVRWYGTRHHQAGETLESVTLAPVER